MVYKDFKTSVQSPLFEESKTATSLFLCYDSVGANI